MGASVPGSGSTAPIAPADSLTLALPPGTWNFVIERPGARPVSLARTLTDGQILDLTPSLDPSAER